MDRGRLSPLRCVLCSLQHRNPIQGTPIWRGRNVLPHLAFLARHLVEFRTDFTVKFPPRVKELSAKLTDPASGQAEHPRDFLVSEPDGQRFRDATFRLRLAAQPRGKVTSERSLLGDGGAVVLDHRLDPFAFLVIKTIQSLDNDPLFLPRRRRQNIPDTLSRPDAPAVILLGDGKTREDGWVGGSAAFGRQTYGF